jgi:hypothetical protein
MVTAAAVDVTGKILTSREHIHWDLYLKLYIQSITRRCFDAHANSFMFTRMIIYTKLLKVKNRIVLSNYFPITTFYLFLNYHTICSFKIKSTILWSQLSGRFRVMMSPDIYHWKKILKIHRMEIVWTFIGNRMDF